MKLTKSTPSQKPIIYINTKSFNLRKKKFYKSILPRFKLLVYRSRTVDYDLIANHVETKFEELFNNQIEPLSIFRMIDLDLKL